MYPIQTLRRIIPIFGFALGILGCVTNKAQTSNVNIFETVKAEAVSEGICLTFKNIPPETTGLFISFQEKGDFRSKEEQRLYTYSYSNDIRESVLDQVKETGKINFPFVKAGHKYCILVMFQRGELVDVAWNDYGHPIRIYMECTPYSGIYFDKKIDLNLNETNTSITLSSEPAFSAEVDYTFVNYEYTACWAEGNAGIKVKADTLTWDIPLVHNTSESFGFVASGDYPAYATAFINIIYDNLPWTIEIAKSGEFTYSYY